MQIFNHPACVNFHVAFIKRVSIAFADRCVPSSRLWADLPSVLFGNDAASHQSFRPASIHSIANPRPTVFDRIFERPLLSSRIAESMQKAFELLSVSRLSRDLQWRRLASSRLGSTPLALDHLRRLLFVEGLLGQDGMSFLSHPV